MQFVTKVFSRLAQQNALNGFLERFRNISRQNCTGTIACIREEKILTSKGKEMAMGLNATRNMDRLTIAPDRWIGSLKWIVERHQTGFSVLGFLAMCSRQSCALAAAVLARRSVSSTSGKSASAPASRSALRTSVRKVSPRVLATMRT